MNYISTRGKAPILDFTNAMLTGLASDGGLYVATKYPKFSANDIAAFADLSYADLAYEILSKFAPDIDQNIFKNSINDTYNSDYFKNEAIAPLIQLNKQSFILELFHGPTFAFKDFALQLFGRLLEETLANTNQQAVIIGATSGDTGSAAIAGCAHSKRSKIFILHPHNKISEIQRKQMTSQIGKNIFNIAVKGSFDDCQSIIKKLFLNKDNFLPKNSHLISANSINCARILAQIIYYFYSALRVGSPYKKVSFIVPTGNFGDIFAGYLAAQMGLPIEKLIIATNENDILHRFMQKNQYYRQSLKQTLSPSMDIQVASNFERLLFDFHNRDSDKTNKLMHEFNKNNKLQIDDSILNKIRQNFTSYSTSNEQILSQINNCYKRNNIIIDPHTATGVFAETQYSKISRNPIIILATAHPAKFPNAFKKAEFKVEIPAKIQNILTKKEKYIVKNANFDEILEYLKNNI